MEPVFESDDEFRTVATATLKQLHELSGRAEKVNVCNPYTTYRDLRAVSAELGSVEKVFYRCLEHSYVELSKRYGGEGAVFAGGILVQHQLAGYLPYYLRLQDSWGRAHSVVEYMRAMALAVLAFYVSIISLVVSIATLF